MLENKTLFKEFRQFWIHAMQNALGDVRHIEMSVFLPEKERCIEVYKRAKRQIRFKYILCIAILGFTIFKTAELPVSPTTSLYYARAPPRTNTV